MERRQNAFDAQQWMVGNVETEHFLLEPEADLLLPFVGRYVDGFDLECGVAPAKQAELADLLIAPSLQGGTKNLIEDQQQALSGVTEHNRRRPP